MLLETGGFTIWELDTGGLTIPLEFGGFTTPLEFVEIPELEIEGPVPGRVSVPSLAQAPRKKMENATAHTKNTLKEMCEILVKTGLTRFY